MDFEFFNKYYLKIREDNAIVDAFSDGPNNKRSTDGYICFGKGGYQLRLYPGGKENPPLYTMDSIPLYKWDGKQVIPRTESEIAADRAAIPAPPPSEQEQLRADIDFLAAMQGVNL